MSKDQEDQEMKKMMEKNRVSVTLTNLYFEALNKLVNVGIFATQGEVFRAALRMLFASYGMESFVLRDEGNE